MTSNQSADPAKCAETGENIDNYMTAMDCIQDEQVILKTKEFSRITDPLLGHALYRYPHQTLLDHRECDQDAANLRHYYIDVLHGYLFCEHRECWWLQLTFSNKDSCIEHVDEIGTILLRGHAFKFNRFSSIYNLAGQGEVKMHIVAPCLFRLFDSSAHSFPLERLDSALRFVTNRLPTSIRYSFFFTRLHWTAPCGPLPPAINSLCGATPTGIGIVRYRHVRRLFLACWSHGTTWRPRPLTTAGIQSHDP
jgi:hypothetical protein